MFSEMDQQLGANGFGASGVLGEAYRMGADPVSAGRSVDQVVATARLNQHRHMTEFNAVNSSASRVMAWAGSPQRASPRARASLSTCTTTS